MIDTIARLAGCSPHEVVAHALVSIYGPIDLYLPEDRLPGPEDHAIKRITNQYLIQVLNQVQNQVRTRKIGEGVRMKTRFFSGGAHVRVTFRAYDDAGGQAGEYRLTDVLIPKKEDQSLEDMLDVAEAMWKAGMKAKTGSMPPPLARRKVSTLDRSRTGKWDPQRKALKKVRS